MLMILPAICAVRSSSVVLFRVPVVMMTRRSVASGRRSSIASTPSASAIASVRRRLVFAYRFRTSVSGFRFNRGFTVSGMLLKTAAGVADAALRFLISADCRRSVSVADFRFVVFCVSLVVVVIADFRFVVFCVSLVVVVIVVVVIIIVVTSVTGSIVVEVIKILVAADCCQVTVKLSGTRTVAATSVTSMTSVTVSSLVAVATTAVTLECVECTVRRRDASTVEQKAERRPVVHLKHDFNNRKIIIINNNNNNNNTRTTC